MNTKLKLTLSKSVRLLGDPHLGKTFTKNVPLESRGLRETMVRNDFINSYTSGTYKLHICVGDLFDKFRVSEETLMFAYSVVRQAAVQYPKRTFVILQGNHDASRDVSLVSSFHVLKELLSPFKNVFVITDAGGLTRFTVEGQCYTFFPWMPFDAADVVATAIGNLIELKDTIAVGHWDIEDFSGLDSVNDNLIPYDILKDCKGIVSGHYHNAKTFKAETGVTVMVTGSMQPYSHSEDAEGKLYQTMPQAEAAQMLEDLGEEAFALINLRVLLAPDEDPELTIKCLSLTYKRSLSEEDEGLDVAMDTFSIESVFKNTFEEFEVSESLTTELWVLGQESADVE